MRLFELERLEDESGVSGTGIVAQGVEFDDGACIMKWSTSISSIGIYKNLAELEFIHGHGGKTQVHFK